MNNTKQEPIKISFEAVESNGNYYFFIPIDKYQILMSDDKNIVIGSRQLGALKQEIK